MYTGCHVTRERKLGFCDSTATLLNQDELLHREVSDVARVYCPHQQYRISQNSEAQTIPYMEEYLTHYVVQVLLQRFCKTLYVVVYHTPGCKKPDLQGPRRINIQAPDSCIPTNEVPYPSNTSMSNHFVVSTT